MLITDPPLVEHATSTATSDITIKTFAIPTENESFIYGLPLLFAPREPKISLGQRQRYTLPFRRGQVVFRQLTPGINIILIARMIREIKGSKAIVTLK